MSPLSRRSSDAGTGSLSDCLLRFADIRLLLLSTSTCWLSAPSRNMASPLATSSHYPPPTTSTTSISRHDRSSLLLASTSGVWQRPVSPDYIPCPCPRTRRSRSRSLLGSRLGLLLGANSLQCRRSSRRTTQRSRTAIESSGSSMTSHACSRSSTLPVRVSSARKNRQASIALDQKSGF